MTRFGWIWLALLGGSWIVALLAVCMFAQTIRLVSESLPT